jgi:hypothetical protein
MTLFIADTASALEDTGVRAVRFVVAVLATVEAGTATSLTRLWALASKVTRLTAAVGSCEQYDWHEIYGENLLAAGVVTGESSVVTTKAVSTKVVLFVQGSKVCGRTSCTPVVAVIGPFVFPACHLSQSRSVRVVLEMCKMSLVTQNRWNWHEAVMRVEEV